MRVSRGLLSSNTNNHNDLENHGAHYQIPISKLQSIFDPKSLRNFNNVGSLDTIVNDINTDLHNGLSTDHNDKFDRVKIYGENRLPQRLPKSFWNLCCEALRDRVLIILSISAVISLILGLYQTFYEPPQLDDDGKPLPQIQWVDGFAILLAVLIVVIVGALNDYNKEKQFQKLNNKKDDRNVIVYRSNTKMYISIYDLLVGDILYIETGDVLPADSILISGECSCDESSITGESRTIEKATIYKAVDYYNDEVKSTNSSSSSLVFDVGDMGVLDPFLISGSKLLSGQGKALVLCVGENSVNGKIMKSLSIDDSNEVTPLQERLDNLANGISKYGFMAAASLLVILFMKFFYQLATTDVSKLPLADKLSISINIIITAIIIIVVAIPEGLPLAVTLSLAFATTRMTEDGNLVRVLKSCETMGGATTICSDKTGTLTINKMTIVKGLLDHEILFDDVSSPGSSINVFKQCSNNLLDLLIKNIILNSTAFENSNSIEKDTESEILKPKKSLQNLLFNSKKYKGFLPLSSTPSSEQNETEKKADDFVGSKTECALLSLVKNKFTKINSHSFPKLTQYRDSNAANVITIIPFESSIKWSGIVYHNSNDNSYTFLIKGAAEIILDKCDSIIRINGKVQNLSDDEKSKIDKIRESMASKALRAVSLAHHTFTEDEISKIGSGWSDLTSDDLSKYPLTLDLMVGIQDPLRPGVKDAIEQCHRAGVTVRMVTGDNVLTARAISRSCGILNDETFDDPKCFMEGPQFRELSEHERIQIVPNLHVLARSSPEDKRILVETLKEINEVVAVTGDGTNDAPALKLADVGFSMGLSGTEVAREASDIVLMSDDFSSIVNAIKWGRTVAKSIRKFVQFQLTVNFTAVLLTFITSINSSEDTSVLTAVQLLWVNLIMDTLAALALATDKPDQNILDSKPEGRNNKMISVNMWKMILGMSIFQLIIMLIINCYSCYFFFGKSEIYLKTSEKMALRALTFNSFVWMQVFTMFVSRILNEPMNLNSDSTLMDRLCSQNIGFFKDLARNYWFICITGLISILQVLIMIFGGPAFSVATQSTAMWLTALLSGYAMIPIGTLLRIIPDEFLLKYLPMSTLYKLICGFEWIVFGCGMFTPKLDIEETYTSGRYANNDNNNGNTREHGNNTPYDTGVLSNGSPSPLLENANSGESHKLNRLSNILLDSNNSSVSSFHNTDNNNNNKNNKSNYKPKYKRSRTPSQNFLLDESSNIPIYDNTPDSISNV